MIDRGGDSMNDPNSETIFAKIYPTTAKKTVKNSSYGSPVLVIGGILHKKSASIFTHFQAIQPPCQFEF